MVDEAVGAIRPMTISYSAEAEAMIRSYRRAMRARALAQPAMASIYARCAEHAIKLALVAHDRDAIGHEAMDWGIRTADACAGYLIEAVQRNVAENDFERASNRVLGIVGEGRGDWVDHRRLVYGTRQINARTRNEIVLNLVESGRAVVEDVKVEGANKLARRYRVAG